MSGSTLRVPLEYRSVVEGKTPRSLSPRTLATWPKYLRVIDLEHVYPI